MIKKHIENVRTKSYAEKSNTAFVASLILTSIVAGMWFLTVFTNPDEYFKPQEVTTEQKLANAGSLFDALKQGVK